MKLFCTINNNILMLILIRRYNLRNCSKKQSLKLSIKLYLLKSEMQSSQYKCRITTHIFKHLITFKFIICAPSISTLKLKEKAEYSPVL